MSASITRSPFTSFRFPRSMVLRIVKSPPTYSRSPRVCRRYLLRISKPPLVILLRLPKEVRYSKSIFKAPTSSSSPNDSNLGLKSPFKPPVIVLMLPRDFMFSPNRLKLPPTCSNPSIFSTLLCINILLLRLLPSILLS